MSKNINEMNTGELAKLTSDIKALVPAHTFWAEQPSAFNGAAVLANVGTWSTPTGMWTIEVNYQSNRYVVRQGSDNKWTRFDDDLSWLESTLVHLGGLS